MPNRFSGKQPPFREEYINSCSQVIHKQILGKLNVLPTAIVSVIVGEHTVNVKLYAGKFEHKFRGWVTYKELAR